MQKLIAIIFLTISALSSAQNYSTGLAFDYESASKLPRQAVLLTRGYEILPSCYSLQQYCPTPMSQGHYENCTAWASTYAAMTIAYAIANNWYQPTIDREAFAPWFTYYMIKDKSNSKAYNCTVGTAILHAGNLMLNDGVPKKRDYDIECENSISKYGFVKHKIDYFKSLFVYRQKESRTLTLHDIWSVKMALANQHPVIIGSECYKSLSSATDKWSGIRDYLRGYHAMCVVAYDDNKYGGSFLVQNSWGTDWGNNGYTWITYNDFTKAVYEAYEIFVEPKRPLHLLSGSLRLQLSTGEEMRGTLSGGIYKISGEYISGTRYRIYISNNQPAYVYVIGSDLQNNVSKVFPPNDRISPALTYKSNNIAIPDENWYVQMDNTVGKDYVCVLYSAEELDIQTIISKIRSGYGSFYDKVSSALSGKLATSTDVNFSQNTIYFSAQTNKPVVAVIAEVVHR